MNIEINSSIINSAHDVFQTEVADWASKTFPDSTKKSKKIHLKEEAEELVHAYHCEDDNAVLEEAADVFLIALHLAESLGVSFHDMVRAKFEKCKARKWGKPDADGVVRHIEAIHSP